MASEILNGRQLKGPIRMIPSYPSYSAFRLLPTVGDFDGVASSTLPLGANLDTAVTD